MTRIIFRATNTKLDQWNFEFLNHHWIVPSKVDKINKTKDLKFYNTLFKWQESALLTLGPLLMCKVLWQDSNHLVVEETKALCVCRFVLVKVKMFSLFKNVLTNIVKAVKHRFVSQATLVKRAHKGGRLSFIYLFIYFQSSYGFCDGLVQG